MKALPVVLALLVSVLTNCCSYSLPMYTDLGCSSNPVLLASNTTEEAYVTVLHDGDSTLGVHVLGQSLRETKTTRDLIVLVTEDVSQSDRRSLALDGWSVLPVRGLHGPYAGCKNKCFPILRYMTKLLVWKLVQYRRIVYLGADTLVISNIDILFNCGRFCAAFRHCDLFNSHVMVIKPDIAVFNNMMKKVCEFSSYNGADQGFLNKYFITLQSTGMFDPFKPSKHNDSLLRLPSVYNGDIGTYSLGSHWVRSITTFKVVHYSLGRMKPWKWWSHMFFDIVWKWDEIRMKLPNDYPCSNLSPVYWPWMHTILVLLLLLTRRFWYRYYRTIFNHPKFVAGMAYILATEGVMAFVYPVTVTLISYYLAFQMVPSTLHFYSASLTFLNWILFYLLFFYGFICHLISTISHSYRRLQPRSTKPYFSPGNESLLWLVLSVVPYSALIFGPTLVNNFHQRVCIFFVMVPVNVIFHHKGGRRLIKIWSL